MDKKEYVVTLYCINSLVLIKYIIIKINFKVVI